jgi:hypothetical protein
MAIQISLAPYWWTPEGEDGDKPVRYKFKHLTARQQGELFVMTQSADQSDRVESFYLALKYGLLDWENHYEDGKPMACTPENWNKLPFSHLQRVALAVMKGSSITEDQEKN